MKLNCTGFIHLFYLFIAIKLYQRLISDLGTLETPPGLTAKLLEQREAPGTCSWAGKWCPD